MNNTNENIVHNENLPILKANIYIIVSGILYGFLGYLGTMIIKSGISIPDMLFWRFFIAGCWMVIFSIKRHYQKNIFTNLNKDVLFILFTLGAVGYAGCSGFYFLASRYTGTGIAMVIFFTYPIFVLVYALLAQGKKITIFMIGNLIIIITGIFLLNNTKSNIDGVGIIFAILAAISYAMYILVSKKFAYLKIDSALMTTVICFVTALIFLIFSLATHSLTIPRHIHTWFYILAVGIIGTAAPIQLMLVGLKHVSSIKASIISVLEPVVTVIVGMVLLQESASFLQIIGIIILLVGTICVLFQKE